MSDDAARHGEPERLRRTIEYFRAELSGAQHERVAGVGRVDEHLAPAPVVFGS